MSRWLSRRTNPGGPARATLPHQPLDRRNVVLVVQSYCRCCSLYGVPRRLPAAATSSRSFPTCRMCCNPARGFGSIPTSAPHGWHFAIARGDRTSLSRRWCPLINISRCSWSDSWQFFHVVKQHYGMFNIYAAKAGYRGDRRVAKYMLFAGCFAPPVSFAKAWPFDYVVLGSRLPFSIRHADTADTGLSRRGGILAFGVLLAAMIDRFGDSRGRNVLPRSPVRRSRSHRFVHLPTFSERSYALILIATVMHTCSTM